VQVKSMKQMFWEAGQFKQDIERWNTAQVTTMRDMFNNAVSFQPAMIQGWNVQRVTDNAAMIQGFYRMFCKVPLCYPTWYAGDNCAGDPGVCTEFPTRTVTTSMTTTMPTTPTGLPTGPPTGPPTGAPTGLPTGPPTGSPTAAPTGFPTGPPTGDPAGPTTAAAVHAADGATTPVSAHGSRQCTFISAERARRVKAKGYKVGSCGQ